MVVWICVKAGDVQGIFNQPAKVSGKTHRWLWLATFSSTTNAWLTGTMNMSDYSRFAKSGYVDMKTPQFPTEHINDT